MTAYLKDEICIKTDVNLFLSLKQDNDLPSNWDFPSN